MCAAFRLISADCGERGFKALPTSAQDTGDLGKAMAADEVFDLAHAAVVRDDRDFVDARREPGSARAHGRSLADRRASQAAWGARSRSARQFRWRELPRRSSVGLRACPLTPSSLQSPRGREPVDLVELPGSVSNIKIAADEALAGGAHAAAQRRVGEQRLQGVSEALRRFVGRKNCCRVRRPQPPAPGPERKRRLGCRRLAPRGRRSASLHCRRPLLRCWACRRYRT